MDVSRTLHCTPSRTLILLFWLHSERQFPVNILRILKQEEPISAGSLTVTHTSFFQRSKRKGIWRPGRFRRAQGMVSINLLSRLCLKPSVTKVDELKAGEEVDGYSASLVPKAVVLCNGFPGFLKIWRQKSKQVTLQWNIPKKWYLPVSSHPALNSTWACAILCAKRCHAVKASALCLPSRDGTRKMLETLLLSGLSFVIYGERWCCVWL